jgi:molybdate transport system substrate-binding protein
MCARSMHVAVGVLGKAFADAAGHEIDFVFDTVGGLQSRLDAGEAADVVILSVPGIDKLERAGALVGGSRKNVARTFIALCIREGVPRPDFSTADAFTRLLHNASVIACSDPAVGGSAGVHLAKAFEQEGLASMMAGKALPQRSGVEVAKRVVEGKAEFGLTLSGEIASVPGAVIAGALPPPFGQDTIYCAAIMAGSTAPGAAAELISALTKPETREAWRKAGFELP